MTQSALQRLSTIQNLRIAWRDFTERGGIKSLPGVDGVTPEVFRKELDQRLSHIARELQSTGSYSFSALRGVVLPKTDPSKTRLICVPTVADRLVQRALLTKIEPHATKLGIENDVSFGFIKSTPGRWRGTEAARDAAAKLRGERPWVLKTDIQSFFDNIDRNLLVSRFSREFHLQSLVSLVNGVVRCEVHESSRRVRDCIRENAIKRGKGLRQGMPLSPTLSNFVLADFDRLVGASHTMIRYADDMVIFGRSQSECEEAQRLVEFELKKLRLGLSGPKTMLVRPDDPVEFLGMELGRLKGSSRYRLTVSQAQISKIRESFKALYDWQDAYNKQLTAIQVFIRVERMKDGYLLAYRLAENIGSLRQQIEQWSTTCADRIYGSLFGKASVKQLTPEQRVFLGMPRGRMT